MADPAVTLGMLDPPSRSCTGSQRSGHVPGTAAISPGAGDSGFRAPLLLHNVLLSFNLTRVVSPC